MWAGFPLSLEATNKVAKGDPRTVDGKYANAGDQDSGIGYTGDGALNLDDLLNTMKAVDSEGIPTVQLAGHAFDGLCAALPPAAGFQDTPMPVKDKGGK
jgi:hypothetical protein